MFKKDTHNTWLLNLNQYRTNPLPKNVTTKKGWEWDGCQGNYYSDDGEDGILEYLFEYIDDVNKFGVDIGSAHGYGGSNMRFLADKNDWNTTIVRAAMGVDEEGGYLSNKTSNKNRN